MSQTIASDGAGVIHQRGQRAELAVDDIEQAHDIGIDGGIGLHRDRFAAALADRRDDILRLVRPASIVDRDGEAALRGELRCCCADAAATASDDCNFFMRSPIRVCYVQPRFSVRTLQHL